MRIPVGVWVLAAGKVVFHLATTLLSHHRDELYFIAASKRLSASYVDFQPVTPLLVRVVRVVSGESLLALRLIPAVAGAITVVLAALIAREIGGSRRSQIFAAFVVAVVPLFVGMSSALNTVSLETPAWMLVVYLFARLIRTDEPRWWLGVGAAIGLALLVKFTVLAYIGGLVVAVVATSLRRHLRTPWPWAGALVALTIVAPSVWWQATHGFPVIEFVSNQGTGGKVLGLGGRLGYLVSLVLLPGPLALLVLIPGARRLATDFRWRALGIAHAVVLLAFLVASGKGYYAAPAIAVVAVAGAVAVAERAGRLSRATIMALLLNLLVPLPLLVPLVPVSVLARSPDLAEATEMGERVGWEELARDVKAEIAKLPERERERAVFIGENYALPAAIEYHGVPDAPVAVSGHNSSYLWWPELPRDHVAVVIGFSRRFLQRAYTDVEQVGTVSNREGIENYERGKPIWIVRGPRISGGELRERVKLFTA